MPEGQSAIRVPVSGGFFLVLPAPLWCFSHDSCSQVPCLPLGFVVWMDERRVWSVSRLSRACGKLGSVPGEPACLSRQRSDWFFAGGRVLSGSCCLADSRSCSLGVGGGLRGLGSLCLFSLFQPVHVGLSHRHSLLSLLSLYFCSGL